MEEADTRKFLIATILVLVISLVSLDFNDMTGNVPSAAKVTSLSVSQQGNIITVTLKPIGASGKPGKWVDMRLQKGTKGMDEQTQCDYQGPKKGTSTCHREIATFDITGSTWNAGTIVKFSVRGTNIESMPYIIK